MNEESIDAFLENQSLKTEFASRALDLSDVFCSTPDDLERENRVLQDLLDWVLKYTECGNRRQMEVEGYQFPPIYPGISPENDWYRFERWVKGKSLRQKIKDQLPSDFRFIPSTDLNDDDLPSALRRLIELLRKNRFMIEFQNDIPPRLVYEHLIDMQDDEFDIIEEGFWHLDGCSGYCPGCFQRPWCECGRSSCWPEDEEAGKMCIIESVRRFVASSPMSLEILRELQAKEEDTFDEFKKPGSESHLSLDPLPFDLAPDDGLPF